MDTCCYARVIAGQLFSAAATSLGIFTFINPVMGMFGVEQWSALWGMVSVVGLAVVNIYGLVRGTARQHNLADAEASRETWKGKYELEVEANELRKRRIEELQLALKERDCEIGHLRRQLQSRSET